MKYRRRIYYTQADKALMWERWRQGESLHAIAQLFDRNHSAVGAYCRGPAVSDRGRDGARYVRWRCPSVKRSRAGSWPGYRFERSPVRSGARRAR